MKKRKNKRIKRKEKNNLYSINNVYKRTNH